MSLTPTPGTCSVCAADGMVTPCVSPLDAPASFGWCDRCRLAQALPLYFLEARIGARGREPRREMERWADLIARDGWTVWVDGTYLAAGDYLTPERLDELEGLPPPPPRPYLAAFPTGLISVDGRPIGPGDPLRIFVDDERHRRPPAGDWIHVTSAGAAMLLLETGRAASLSLDHDLGPGARDGHEVLLHLEIRLRADGVDLWPSEYLCVHSASAAAARRMVRAIEAHTRLRRDWTAEQPTWRR